MADTPRRSWRAGRAVFSLGAEAGKPGRAVAGPISEEEYSRQTAEMQKRLNDPRLRDELRVETRAQIVWMNPDLAQVLGLDPQAESRLLDLLTDQQMTHLRQYWSGELLPQRPATAAGLNDRQLKRAEEQTRRLEELRNLLGEEGLERYRNYQDTVHQRQAVRLFAARLQQEDQLTSDQSDRLMLLLRQQLEEQLRGRQFESHASHRFPPADPEAGQKHNVALNEWSFWRMQTESQQLISRLPEVLTPRQIDVFVQMEAEKIDCQRSVVEQMRVDAGMSREIPAPGAADEDLQRKRVPGRVKLEISVKVNEGQPTVVSLVTENGRAASFEGPESLWVEATPTLFEDGWADVRFDFYEQSGGKWRALGGSPGMGMQTRHPRRVPVGDLAMRTVITGSRGYALAIGARVTPVDE
jgi:hypothetical protein